MRDFNGRRLGIIDAIVDPPASLRKAEAQRTFVRGRYRLELTGLDRLGERVKVRGNVQGRLR